jgi:hypothetical protein
MVEPYTSNFTVVPYGLLAETYGYIKNSEFSIPAPPIHCQDSTCESYLFPGGLQSTTPWPPTDHPDSPVVEIWNAPAVQIEFENHIDSSDQFLEQDCDVIGSPDVVVGIKVCIAQSQANHGSLIAR